MTTEKETAVTPTQDETKPTICELGKTWCEAMTERLNDVANSHAKGLTTIVLTNFVTGTTRLAGIAYRKGSKDKGLMLNYCPWCAEPIEEGAIAHRAAKAEAVNG